MQEFNRECDGIERIWRGALVLKIIPNMMLVA